MLRRAEHVQVSHRTGLFTSKGAVTLSIGRKSYIIIRKLPRRDYDEMLNRAAQYPVSFGRVGERRYWLFQGRWHWDNDGLNAEHVYAILVTREQRSQAAISRAQTIVAMQQAPTPTVRGAIAADIKQLVWSRDGGCCRQCGANTELQFDHVIPVAYGGASTPDNLQILCGPCNRRKGASVG